MKSPQGVLACDKLLGSIGNEHYFSTNINKNFMWDLSTYLPDERSFVEDENNSFFNLATFSALMYEFILYDTNKDGVLTFDSGAKENTSSNTLQLCSDYTWFNEEGRKASPKEFMIHKLRKRITCRYVEQTIKKGPNTNTTLGYQNINPDFHSFITRVFCETAIVTFARNICRHSSLTLEPSLLKVHPAIFLIWFSPSLPNIHPTQGSLSKV